MIGVNATTGRSLDGMEHLGQSIGDILMTPLGSRVMRRDYGSLLPELIDQPFNDATRMRLFGATALALMRWEPRIRLIRVQLFQGEAAGQIHRGGVAADGDPQILFSLGGQETAHAAGDGDLLAAARDDARLLIERDPQLETPRGQAIRTLLYLFERDVAIRLLRAG